MSAYVPRVHFLSGLAVRFHVVYFRGKIRLAASNMRVDKIMRYNQFHSSDFQFKGNGRTSVEATLTNAVFPPC